jgi:hypothetical protein
MSERPEEIQPDVGPEAPVGETRSARILGRPATRLAFDSVIIVASVLLAFGLNEWRSERAERHLSENVIEGLHAELTANLALMERMQPVHANLAQAIAELSPEALGGRPAFAIIMERRQDDGSLVVPPAEAAWQTAVSTGALRLLDYETVATLSRIYNGQEDGLGRTTARLADIVFSVTMFDPAVGSEAAQVILALMRELAAQEEHLIREYRLGLERLAQIRRAR